MASIMSVMSKCFGGKLDFYGSSGAVSRTVFLLCLRGFSPCSSFPHSSKTCSELEMLKICPGVCMHCMCESQAM